MNPNWLPNRLTPRTGVASLVIVLTLAATGCGSTASVAETQSATAQSDTANEPVVTSTEVSTTTPPTIDTTTTTEAPSTTSTTTTTTEAPSTTTTTSPLYLVDAYDPAADPFADMTEAISRAAAEQKHVVAIVGGDWCPDCLTLDLFIEDRPDLEDSMHQQFILVKINLSEENENPEWLDQYPTIEWVPHFYIFDGEGSLAESYDTRALMIDGLFNEGLIEGFIDTWS